MQRSVRRVAVLLLLSGCASTSPAVDAAGGSDARSVDAGGDGSSGAGDGASGPDGAARPDAASRDGRLPDATSGPPRPVTLWALRGGASGTDTTGSLAPDEAGGVFSLLFMSGSGQVGNLPYTTTSINYLTGFVARVSAAGQVSLLEKPLSATTNSDFLTCLARAPSGALYLGGNLNSAGATLGTVTLKPSSSTHREGFLARLDANGSVRWAHLLGGSVESSLKAMATDTQGNVYVLVTFASSLTLGTRTLQSSQGNFFVAKLDPDGAPLWITQGKASWPELLRVAPTGDILIGGRFTSATLGKTTLIAQGTYGDIFGAKLDAQGAFAWAFGAPGDKLTGRGRLMDLAADGKGQVYAVGMYETSIQWGKTLLTTTGYDGFVTALDDSGQVRWARSLGSPDFDVVNAVAVDGRGYVHVAGNVKGATVIAGRKIVPSTSPFVVSYVLQLDSAGTPRWMETLDGAAVYSLAVDGQSQVYAAGAFWIPTTFGATPLAPATSSGAANNPDLFLWKLSDPP